VLYVDSDSEAGGGTSHMDSGTDTDDMGSHVTRDSACSTPTGSRRRSGSEAEDGRKLPSYIGLFILALTRAILPFLDDVDDNTRCLSTH
jgi:hypothetical protein